MGIVTLLLLIFSGVTAAVAALAAWFTLIRHFGQTNADRQRRITESFAKAVEQLGSDKLEVRLGGIYSLERISKESPDDYWTVMENLTAFVRERSRRNEAERTRDLEQRVSRRAYFLWQEAGRPDGRAEDFWTAAAEQEEFGEPATDIAAVLTVIKRRSEQSRERERANGWQSRSSRCGFETILTSSARISSGPILLGHISSRPSSQRRISGGPPSRGRISSEPSLSGRISSGPTSGVRISREPTSGAQRACQRHSSATPTATPRRNFPRECPGRRIGRARAANQPTPDCDAALFCLLAVTR